MKRILNWHKSFCKRSQMKPLYWPSMCFLDWIGNLKKYLYEKYVGKEINCGVLLEPRATKIEHQLRLTS